MILIAERGSERYHQIVLDGPGDFRAPFDGRPYTCLLWDADGAAGDDARARLSAELVASGCVYAVCGGIGCEAWHDAIDETLVAMLVEGRAADDRFMMTTSHEGESVDAVAAFFVVAAIPYAGVDRHLVLQIGRDRDRQDELWTAVRARVGDGG